LGVLIDRISVPKLDDLDVWPYTVPAIRQIAEEGLTLAAPVTILVGANGSGKSTVLEAIADAYGLDVRGGHGARRYGSKLEPGILGRDLILSRTLVGHRFGKGRNKGFFLRAETAYGMLAYMSGGVPGYGDESSLVISHGESYLNAILGRFVEPGLYLLDEAEGPLSFQATLAVLLRLQDLTATTAAQVIYATHSPLVAALPGADILELDASGVHRRTWEELDAVQLWRDFLKDPTRFFA
jgi:predicted ATPase